jgi:GT2 family glycosyltransferase
MQNVKDWVIFQDHDILQLNPEWYQMILSAIDRHGYSAGFITGVTNLIACPMQFCLEAPRSLEMIDHMRFAKERYKKFGNETKIIIPEKMPLPFSGFFMVTHKKAWEDAGGFKDGFLGVDNYYHEAVIDAGYQTYVMPGLYMFHMYHHKKRWETL